MWIYDSPIGRFIIKYLPNGKFGLIYNNELYGIWQSPQAAADEVYTHTTGCNEWDFLDGQIDDLPTDLSEWIKI